MKPPILLIFNFAYKMTNFTQFWESETCQKFLNWESSAFLLSTNRTLYFPNK